MEFGEVVRRRRMVRSFTDEPIAPEVVDRILEHARRAPSAGFSQGVEFLVLEGHEQTTRYWDACFPPAARHDFAWPALLRAPLLIIPFAHRDTYLDRYAEPDKGWTDRDPDRWRVPYWLVDTSFAAMLVLLTVIDEGLGAVFFGVGDAEAFMEEFDVPRGYNPIGAVAIGHPAPDDRPSRSVARGRRPLDEVVHRGDW